MRYDSTKYDFGDDQNCSVRLLDDAILYRIVAPSFCSPDAVLTASAPVHNRLAGRWHVPMQTATYCSDNVLVCIAEVLFHMYRGVLDKLGTDRPDVAAVRKSCSLERVLTVFAVSEVENLVQLTSRAIVRDYSSAAPIVGTVAIHPDVDYRLFRDLSTELRQGRNGKRGLVYPSARHSQGKCIVFFGDESPIVKPADYTTLEVRLSLISEDDVGALPRIQMCPLNQLLCGFAGYYEFKDPDAFEECKRQGRLNPSSIPQSGVIDFVRRKYANYPTDAVANLPTATP